MSNQRRLDVAQVLVKGEWRIVPWRGHRVHRMGPGEGRLLIGPRLVDACRPIQIRLGAVEQDAGRDASVSG